MTQTRSCKDPAGAQEELTEAPCMLWVCYKAAGLGSHGERVQMCSPAPCSQQEGHQTFCLPLLHPDFQMAHVGPKRGWPRADTAAWPPLEHHSVTVLLCAQACPQLQGGEGGEAPQPAALHGATPEPTPCMLLPELLLFIPSRGRSQLRWHH